MLFRSHQIDHGLRVGDVLHDGDVRIVAGGESRSVRVAVRARVPLPDNNHGAQEVQVWNDPAEAVQQAVANLEPLTGPERAYRLSVRELQALAAQRKGDMKRAREIWAEIARDPGAPQGALQRAQAMLNFGGAEGTK